MLWTVTKKAKGGVKGNEWFFYRNKLILKPFSKMPIMAST